MNSSWNQSRYHLSDSVRKTFNVAKVTNIFCFSVNLEKVNGYRCIYKFRGNQVKFIRQNMITNEDIFGYLS